MKLCKCSCGRQIEIKPYHKYYGIPDYISGHNPVKHTEESKRGLSERQRGEGNVSKREDVRRKMQEAKLKNPIRYWLGKKRSKEDRIKISLAKKGKPTGRRGKKHKQETKDKLSVLKSKQTSELIASGRLFNGNSKYRGKFWSDKNGKYIYYQSFYEKRCLEMFEENQDIISFDRCKIVLIYQKHSKLKRYIPDFEVIYVGDVKKIVEVKPLKLIPYNLEKINALKSYCLQNSISFEIYTEKELGLENVGMGQTEIMPMETEPLPIGQVQSVNQEAPFERWE